MMQKKYQKVLEKDYGDCGFPILHMEQDLYFTHLALLEDEHMRKLSFLSIEIYTRVVDDFFSEVMKEFDEEYYSR